MPLTTFRRFALRSAFAVRMLHIILRDIVPMPSSENISMISMQNSPVKYTGAGDALRYRLCAAVNLRYHAACYDTFSDKRRYFGDFITGISESSSLGSRNTRTSVKSKKFVACSATASLDAAMSRIDIVDKSVVHRCDGRDNGYIALIDCIFIIETSTEVISPT